MRKELRNKREKMRDNQNEIQKKLDLEKKRAWMKSFRDSREVHLESFLKECKNTPNTRNSCYV